MFVDKSKITIKAGDGGMGAVAFHREKYVAAGGPSGGDGGKGGNVYFMADKSLSTLLDFRYKTKYKAQSGEQGRAKNCFGKAGEDLIIRLPQGTVVKEANTGRVVADISELDVPVLIAKGGKGGWGNAHFATPTRQTPRFAKPGLPGEELELVLELKLLADVGLVGFPNVGKSSIISVVSAAKPTIANYHFTTLTPVLGVVKVEEGKNFVVADIPGLIEDASEGVGLGHAFLRHVDRCRLILHVVDVSGSEGRNPKEDYEIIRRELTKFSPELGERPQLVVGNKVDIATPEQIEDFKSFVEGMGYKFFSVSAATRKGLDALMNETASLLDTLPALKLYEAEAPGEYELEEKDRNAFTVTVEEGIYFVEADWFIRAFGGINPDDYESLQYFQRVLRKSGVIARLEEMGIEEGDLVNILDFEFEYIP